MRKTKKELAMRNNVKLSSAHETVIVERMNAVTPQRIGTISKQIISAVASRKEYQLQDAQLFNGAISKDFRFVEAYAETANIKACAAFFAVIGIPPEYYLNSVAYDPATFESKSGIPSEAKTRNLKGYKKTLEVARWSAGLPGATMESVLTVFLACSILSAQHMTVIPRDVCVRFLDSVPLSHVSEDLADALDHFRAKHMTGGAETQTSQCMLQLATMRAADVVRNGRNKDFQLNLDSPLVDSFAARSGLSDALDRARRFRADIAA